MPLSKLRADARAGIDITVKAEPVIKKSDPAPAVAVSNSSSGSSSVTVVKTETNGNSVTATATKPVKKEVVSDSDDDVPISGLRKKMKVEIKTASSAIPRVKTQPSLSSVRTPTRPKKRVIKVMSQPERSCVCCVWDGTCGSGLCESSD